MLTAWLVLLAAGADRLEVRADDSPVQRKVSLLPHWIPQAQFAGYMVALDKGLYKAAGLDLTLLQGGPERPPLAAIASGQATFCTEWLSGATQAKAAGMDLVNIGQIVQRSALVLIAHRRLGIDTVEDLEGRKIGCWLGDFCLQPKALFRMKNLTVHEVPMYRSANLFFKGGVDAIAAMWYNEYHTVINSGLDPADLTVLFLRDYGLNFPEDGLYCMAETHRKDPDTCARFVNASLKGWLYALEHKDEALDIVMKHCEATPYGTNRSHQRWMLDRMLEIVFPDGDRSGIGILKQSDYYRMADVLKDLELLEVEPRLDEFHMPVGLPLAGR